MFSPKRIRLYAWLSLVSQVLIVVTGGAVRLTGSGLGCPTWPKCTDDSFVNVPEMGIHGVIEFANRLLTFVLAIVALLTFIAVRRMAKNARFGLTWPALVLGLGIVAQAVLGGITVLAGLNPWIVGAHFLVSGVLIAVASVLLWRVYQPKHAPVSPAVFGLAWPIAIAGTLSVIFGVVVTGAGPHAGDAATPRNGLDLEIWQHYHSYPGYLMLALVVLASALLLKDDLGKGFRLWRTQTKIMLLLLAVSLVQALIGVIQARLGVPPLLVGIHMLGASVLMSLLTFQWLAIRSKFSDRATARQNR